MSKPYDDSEFFLKTASIVFTIAVIILLTTDFIFNHEKITTITQDLRTFSASTHSRTTK